VRPSANSGVDQSLLPEGALYATSRQLSRRYQVSLRWIAARSALLGATPISDASNSELRYHLPTADAYMQGRQRSAPELHTRRSGKQPKPITTRNGSPLLSFRQP
jgi:hypothetical protein